MTDQLRDLVESEFTSHHGRPPVGVWAAPGRVNLIGEHTDYNDGFVMPFALEQRVVVAAGPRDDDSWTVASLSYEGTESFSAKDLVPPMTGWQAYVAGVIWALREAGHEISGADFVLTSDVPLGAGLSSSAALECAILTALVDLNNLEIAPIDRARLAQKCENEFVGAPTGLLDQAASTLCRAGHVLFFDCRSTETQQVPCDLAAAGLSLLVLDTHTPHAHVDGEYAARRTSCEQAAQLLGIKALRDVENLDQALAQLSDPVMQRRVRHVVTENARVLDAVEVLSSGRIADLGPLLDASHASMRDDFEITVPTIDLAVEAAKEAGALGARMTGGGFGGCIIALLPSDAAEAAAAHIYQRFAEAGFDQPSHFVAAPAAGAGPA